MLEDELLLWLINYDNRTCYITCEQPLFRCSTWAEERIYVKFVSQIISLDPLKLHRTMKKARMAL